MGRHLCVSSFLVAMPELTHLSLLKDTVHTRRHGHLYPSCAHGSRRRVHRSQDCAEGTDSRGDQATRSRRRGCHGREWFRHPRYSVEACLCVVVVLRVSASLYVCLLSLVVHPERCPSSPTSSTALLPHFSPPAAPTSGPRSGHDPTTLQPPAWSPQSLSAYLYKYNTLLLLPRCGRNNTLERRKKQNDRSSHLEPPDRCRAAQREQGLAHGEGKSHDADQEGCTYHLWTVRVSLTSPTRPSR